MNLVQIFLPLHDNKHVPFPADPFAQTRQELVDAFDGLTAFMQSPAQGLWEKNGETQQDDIAIFEVMTEDVNSLWWQSYRQQLEKRFQQDKIVIRILKIDVV
jgi:hypothetical protein